PYYKLNPAASISVLTKDQEETDQLWAALIADGGSPSQCGWLIDKFGLSWQIIPEALPRLMGSDDKAAAQMAHNAMMNMGKIDIAALESAFNGE
ncbi:MAG: VOC family protein, partial [Candidatus Poribacteria bacterium]|nr:VOC family protein [Candidatus Poribacteria bacterium]